jgi:2-keto-myo-inositol isomerase
MRLAFHGATTMKADLPTDVAVTARAGYGALEVWGAKMDAYLRDHSLAEMGALFRGAGVLPASINSIEFIGFRGPDFALIRDRCRDLCGIAEGIGSPVLVVVPSPTPARAEDGGDLFFPWEKVVDEYVSVLQELAGIAEPYGVTLAFEFLGFAWCSVRTPRGAWEIVQKTGCDNVGVNFDACHFYGGGGELSEIDELDARRIPTFHLNDMERIPKEAIHDSRRLLPGEGVIPLGGICQHLKAIGYDGPAAIELFRPAYWERDPLELAIAARQAALRVLSPYFTVE